MACMTNTPLDIIIYILCRLPTKSVARFRCVSKEWLSLLTDPRFIETHKKTLNKNGFIVRSMGGLLYSVLPYNNHPEALSTLTMVGLGFYGIISILGSVNGLVLASAFKNLHTYVPLLVFNPTTKDYAELPISNQYQLQGMEGIGYDSVSHDYKVVVISMRDKYTGDVNVYNLRTNTWKHTTYSPYDDNKKGWKSGVLVNGFLHWILYRHSKPFIVAFSLADEKFSEFPPPSLYNEVEIMSDIDTKLVALGEKLAIFHGVRGDIWLMNEYGVQKSWIKIVVPRFDEIARFRPKVFYDNGKVLFLTIDQLWTYDVEEQSFCKNVDISNMNIGYFIGACAESLVSPKFSRSK